MRIALTGVFVDDVEAAFEFYTKKLKFVEKLHVPEANLAIVVSPEDRDGTALLLEPNDNPIASSYQKAVRKEGLPVIVFGVDDVKKEYRRLKKLGVEFTQEPQTTEAGTQAVFDDTCGNLVAIFQA